MTYEEFSVKNNILRDKFKDKKNINPFVTYVLTIDRVEGDTVIYTNGAEGELKHLVEAIERGVGYLSNPSKLARLHIWSDKLMTPKSDKIGDYAQHFEGVYKSVEQQKIDMKKQLENELVMLHNKFNNEYRDKVIRACTTIKNWTIAYNSTDNTISSPYKMRRNLKEGYMDGRPRLGVGVGYGNGVSVLSKSDFTTECLTFDINNYKEYGKIGICLSINCRGLNAKYSKKNGWCNTYKTYESEFNFVYWLDSLGRLWYNGTNMGVPSDKRMSKIEEDREGFLIGAINFYKGLMLDFDNFEQDLIKDMQAKGRM